MIHIEQNQVIKENDNFQVLSVSGDYSDNDLIEYQDINNPGVSIGVFQAQFVKYGSLVYRFNEPEDLGRALVELDTECTHDAAVLYKESEARQLKRNSGDLTPDNPVPVDENISQVAQEAAVLEEAKIVENNNQTVIPDQIIEPTNLDATIATESPSMIEIPNNLPQVDTTTDQQINTTTDQIISDTVNDLEKISNNVSDIIDVANKSQEIIDALTAAPIN